MKKLLFMGILNNPNRMIPIRAYSLEKHHLLTKMIVFQGALIVFFINLLIYPLYSQTNLLTKKSQSSTTNYNGEVIFIYASKVCGCTKRKCNLMNNELKSIQTNQKYKNIKFTTINYSEDKKTANTILKEYNMNGIPVCIILDKEKKVKYSVSSVLDKKKCKQTLDALIKRKNN